MDKETVAKILAYVEKNCTEVEEVEEYLWGLLDESNKKSDGIEVDKAFGFLFEKENNSYDTEYNTYIENDSETIQNKDIKYILEKLLNEGFSDDELLIEFNKRVKKYNDFLNDKIQEFRKDLEK